MSLSFKGIVVYIPLEGRAQKSPAKVVLGWQMRKGPMDAH